MKQAKLLFLLIVALAFASCGSDEPRYADPEAHEKTVQLDEKYAPLMVGTWHYEKIGERHRYFERLTFKDDGMEPRGRRQHETKLSATGSKVRRRAKIHGLLLRCHIRLCRQDYAPFPRLLCQGRRRLGEFPARRCRSKFLKTVNHWMNKAKYLFLLIAALAFDSCRPTAQQTVADAEQPTDSTEALTSVDTLRLVIADKSLSQTDFLIRRTQKPVN